LKLGIVTRNDNSWSSTQLRKALTKRNVPHLCFSFPKLAARVGYKPYMKVNSVNVLEDLDALIVRPVGRGSIEELVFRMDVLYRLQRLGLYIINPPEAIEHCVDKYDVLALLEEGNLPVPRTVTTENVDEALKAFIELDRDVVIKPLFGSRGLGSTRIRDEEIAFSVFRAIRFYHGMIYLQEFLPHGSSDIRAFVIDGQVVAAMRRVAKGWKTNYSQGSRPESMKLAKNLDDMAIKSAECVGCNIAGVDILETRRGPYVVEVNSQPGWKGLQSVTRISVADRIVEFILSQFKR